MKAYKIRTGEHYKWWLVVAGFCRADASKQMLSQCLFVMVMDTDECVFSMSVHLLYTYSATSTAKMMLKFDLERERKLLDELNNLILLEVGIWDVSVQLYIDGVSKECWGKGNCRYAGLKASFLPHHLSVCLSTGLQSMGLRPDSTVGLILSSKPRVDFIYIFKCLQK